ncbi:MAG: HPr(Ser) kinase/phosphatase [Ruminococcaceae bacterium]|nr:HPr(Ser) kinase/phosphatase [Oscillospiraceae bacterium]
MGAFSVTLQQIINECNLETVYADKDLNTVKISTTDVSRPGLQFVDFFDYFDPNRIQIFGKVERTFLEQKTSEERLHCIRELCKRQIPAIIISRNQEVFPEFLNAAEEFRIPVLRTAQTTSKFMARLIAFLNVELAERVTLHGVLCEVYGEGVLIMGESGVGKSETAIELVKRGHRLVADDAVEVKKVSDKSLVGTAPENIRHFIEIRGIGIIDVRRIFGMGSIKETEKIDLIIKLEAWDPQKQYDRLGLITEYTELLGNKIPSLNIPVKPGRNLAVVVEVAAMNNRQKKMGYNAAEELNNRLIEQMSKDISNS